MASGSAPGPKVMGTKTVSKVIPLSGAQSKSLNSLIQELQDVQKQLGINGGSVSLETSSGGYTYYRNYIKGLRVSGRVKLTEKEIEAQRELKIAQLEKKKLADQKRKEAADKRKELQKIAEMRKLQAELKRVTNLAKKLGVDVSDAVISDTFEIGN